MTDIERIELLSVANYKSAFMSLRDQMTESDLLMLKVNYESSSHTTTATRLSRAVGFANFNAANLRYGGLAGKFCEFFQVWPSENLSTLVIFERPDNEWLWKMRPQVVEALRELRWFSESQKPDIIQEIEDFKATYEQLEETTRETVIQSRIGQGQFRANLIDYWGGCAVTGCQVIEILKASHIKPWRMSTNDERLDPYNGLLMLPNLDTVFDLGLISFQNSGCILISNRLSEEALLQLGINFSMELARIEQQHCNYLQFHRENIFRNP